MITHGVGWGRVDATARGVAAGDELVAGAGGALVARGPVRVGDVVTLGSSIGFALQQASGKRLMAVFVSPH